MVAEVPLPFSCGHEAYRDGEENDHGNTAPDWADPVSVDCFWWDPSSTEPLQGPTGGDTVIADRVLVINAALSVDHRDRFTFGDERFEVDGLPGDYNHGPFGYAPGRLVIALKRVS